MFFTAVDHLNEPQRDPPYDVKEPRLVPFRIEWKVYQNAVDRSNLKSAQERGLVFRQTNSNLMMSHPNKDALIAELQRNSYTPYQKL